MRRGLAALLLLAVAGPLLAQPKDEPPAEKEPPDAVEDLQGKVSLALNTGGHTFPIQRMTFTPDGKRLVTARGLEVRSWDVATGQPQRVWRLPKWVGHLAVSPDGKTVAAGGGLQVRADGKTRDAALWLLDLDTGDARVLRPGIGIEVTALAFSPDGSRLAWGDGPWANVYDLKAKTKTHVIPPPPKVQGTSVARLLWSKDGNQLLTALYAPPAGTPAAQVWDVRPPAQAGPAVRLKAPLFALDRSDDIWVARTADDSRFATLRAEHKHGVTVYAADGKQELVFDKGQLEAQLGPGGWWWHGGGIHFLPDGRLVAAAARWLDGAGERQTGTAVLLDPATKEVRRLYQGPVQVAEYFTTALAPDGKLLALTGDPGYEVILWDVAASKEVRRLGLTAPAPKFAGWGKDSRTIAWGFTQPKGKPRAAALAAGLNLATLEPLGEGEHKDLRTGEWNPEKWKIFTEKGPGRKDRRDGVVLVRPDGERIETPVHAWMTAWTFYNDAGGRTRVVVGAGKNVLLLDPETNRILSTLDASSGTRVHDLAVSPDGKYLLVAWGAQTLHLFRIDGDRPKPLLTVLVAGADWVVWTHAGYYAATPGGEKLVGWQVKRDDDSPLAFYPVERFRKLFYKPEVIEDVLEKGVPTTRGTEVEEALPPVVDLKVEQTGRKVKVQATAKAASASQPVVSLRLLLDGRPWADARPHDFPPRGQKSVAAPWEGEVPPGDHELKVLARCPDVAGVSETVAVRTPLPDRDRPVLYRLCVGINQYDQTGLALSSAKQDAEAVFEALEKCCTGKGNRFREARGKKLLEKEATREAVRDALKDVRKQGAKPGDLLVVFFAGHGVVQGGEFYLLTREADTGKKLAGLSLSGEDLRQAFSDVPCSVLLLMDACHSAAGVKALKLRPATDDLTRSLTDDQVAVTVLAAAMGYETAGERPGHGLFTEALLKGLNAGTGVPFDPYDHLMYAHHLYSHVFSEVRKASAGKQNPFLNMPWTVPPLALRQVP
jgi:WD40 repeat protein